MSKSTSNGTSSPPPGWQSVVLPLLAGLLHLQVFYYASVHCILRALGYAGSSSTGSTTSEEFQHECYLMDRAVFTAYVFDLLCCYLKVIPFSRSNSSKDIIGHHMPTLVMALPLAVPLWANLRWSGLEATSFSILDDDADDAHRTDFMKSYLLASGFAYVSSLNEVIMCFQRVEMSWAGIKSFREIPLMKKHFFTSRIAVGTELGYKLCFFWGMSIIACKACCDFDKALYDSITAPRAYDGSLGRTLVTVYSSPAVLRGALFRAFSLAMYPSMGLRCLKKLKQFHREGKGAKQL